MELLQNCVFPKLRNWCTVWASCVSHSSECALIDSPKDTIANKGEKLLPVREYKMDTDVCSQLCSRFIWEKKKKKKEKGGSENVL